MSIPKEPKSESETDWESEWDTVHSPLQWKPNHNTLLVRERTSRGTTSGVTNTMGHYPGCIGGRTCTETLLEHV